MSFCNLRLNKKIIVFLATKCCCLNLWEKIRLQHFIVMKTFHHFGFLPVVSLGINSIVCRVGSGISPTIISASESPRFR